MQSCVGIEQCAKFDAIKFMNGSLTLTIILCILRSVSGHYNTFFYLDEGLIQVADHGASESLILAPCRVSS